MRDPKGRLAVACHETSHHIFLALRLAELGDTSAADACDNLSFDPTSKPFQREA